MAKLIQICASANDLFGLDSDGIVYQYNFKTNGWVNLGHGQDDRGDSSVGQPASAQPQSRNTTPRSRG